jgi:Icc-related predicted phosphoesterase
MRILFASDLHGSEDRCDKLFAAAQREERKSS